MAEPNGRWPQVPGVRKQDDEECPRSKLFPAFRVVASKSPNLTMASQSLLVSLVRTAWAESPTLAIELVTRFPFPRLHAEVRWLLLNVPAKAVHEPEAIPILLQEKLPSDVNFLQLKVRLHPLHLLPAFLVAIQSLTARIALALLGTRKPHHSSHFLHPGVSEQPVHHPVCDEGARVPLG